MTQKITIATHNGAFHADDVFAVAVLLALYPDADVIRTRDAALIDQADFAVDVGGIWNPGAGRFDHHQKGFTGQRADGVVYASAGLIWTEYGQAFVAQLKPTLSSAQQLALAHGIDVDLVQHLDMADTGAAQGAAGYFGLSALISAFNTSRNEDKAALALSSTPDQVLAQAKLDQFMEAVHLVRVILDRLVEQGADEITSADIVRNAPTTAEGRILVLPEAGLSWTKVVCLEMPEVLLVVYPDSTDEQFQIRTVPVEPESFKARKDLPEAWAGLRFADLAQVTGVADAVFCHNGRFIGGAGSKEGAISLAKLALASA